MPSGNLHKYQLLTNREIAARAGECKKIRHLFHCGGEGLPATGVMAFAGLTTVPQWRRVWDVQRL
jgi:hypothetical protein